MTLEEVKLRLADNIRRRRKELGLSQAKLAKKVGIDPRFISDLENCKLNASIEYLYKISEGLDISYEYLFNHHDI